MHNEFAKCEIKTSVFSGRKPPAGNYCMQVTAIPSFRRRSRPPCYPMWTHRPRRLEWRDECEKGTPESLQGRARFIRKLQVAETCLEQRLSSGQFVSPTIDMGQGHGGTAIPPSASSIPVLGERQELISLWLGDSGFDGDVIIRERRGPLQSSLVRLHLLGGHTHAIGILTLEAFHRRVLALPRHPQGTLQHHLPALQ